MIRNSQKRFKTDKKKQSKGSQKQTKLVKSSQEQTKVAKSSIYKCKCHVYKWLDKLMTLKKTKQIGHMVLVSDAFKLLCIQCCLKIAYYFRAPPTTTIGAGEPTRERGQVRSEQVRPYIVQKIEPGTGYLQSNHLRLGYGQAEGLT